MSREHAGTQRGWPLTSPRLNALPLPWSGDCIPESSGSGLGNEKTGASQWHLVPAWDSPHGCGPWGFGMGTLDFSTEHSRFSIKHIEALVKLLGGTCGIYQTRGVPERAHGHHGVPWRVWPAWAPRHPQQDLREAHQALHDPGRPPLPSRPSTAPPTSPR